MELINSIGLSVVAFLFVLGVMIFIHELGHYLMAKYLGIRVEVFSLGFGPRLFGFRRGETDYRISILPLGGYVKMTGEGYEEELTGAPDEFMSRPKFHRFLVAVAGPVMNIALAIVLLSTNFMIGVPVPSFIKEAAVIGSIDPGSPAAKSGLQVKDKIVAVEGEQTPTWQDVQFAIATRPNEKLALTLERAGRIFRKEVTTVTEREAIGTIGVDPYEPYVISQVVPASPAAQAGLQPGDQIVEVSSTKETARNFKEIQRAISSSRGEPLQFKVKRNDAVFERTIATKQMEGKHRIGIEIEPPAVIERYGFLEAISRSVKRNYQLTMLTFDIVGRLITGNASIQVMSGPIEIARYSGLAAQTGLIPLMGFMAVISLQLGIFNLLPIPILDGGVIALLALEGLIRRDLSITAKERIAQIGFIFLILLMGIVIFNDISKNLPNL